MRLKIKAHNDWRDIGLPSSCNALQLPPFLFFFDTQTLIIQIAERRPAKIYQRFGLRLNSWNWLRHFPTSPINFTEEEGQKCEIWRIFSTSVALDALWFPNGATHRKSKTFTLPIDFRSYSDTSSNSSSFYSVLKNSRFRLILAFQAL